MNKRGAINIVREFAEKHSPELLTGIGISGMIVTTVLAIKATPKAIHLLEMEKECRIEAMTQHTPDNKVLSFPNPEPLTKIEIVKTVYKCYVPMVITGTLSVACLIGASSVHIRRNTALATAYSLSESALKLYRDKVIETVGEKKEQTIRDSVAKERLDKKPVQTQNVILTNKGNTLCFDVFSGRYFRSDIEKLKQTVNELNRRMLEDTYLSLNDLYYEIGLENIPIGDDIGWDVNNGLIDLRFSSQLSTDGTPCLVMDYEVRPKYMN